VHLVDAQPLPTCGHFVKSKSSTAEDSNGKEKIPASNPASKARNVTKIPSFASRQRPQARESLVSATVYLPPDKLALIKQNCADTNRRISDFISQAIDDYLSKRR
jgi:hypothetical protein